PRARAPRRRRPTAAARGRANAPRGGRGARPPWPGWRGPARGAPPARARRRPRARRAPPTLLSSDPSGQEQPDLVGTPGRQPASVAEIERAGYVEAEVHVEARRGAERPLEVAGPEGAVEGVAGVEERRQVHAPEVERQRRQPLLDVLHRHAVLDVEQVVLVAVDHVGRVAVQPAVALPRRAQDRLHDVLRRHAAEEEAGPARPLRRGHAALDREGEILGAEGQPDELVPAVETLEI